MYTLKLDTETWDIEKDSAGNISLTTGAYAIAQTVANTVRLFKNDAYFEQDRGIPHFDIDLGSAFSVSESVLRSRVKQAALAVSGVKDAEVTLEYATLEYEEEEKKKRVLGGQIRLTLTDGTTVQVGF